MSDSVWDRIGAAGGGAFVVLIFVALGLFGGFSNPPAPTAPSDEILRFLSRPRSPLRPLGEAAAGLALIFLLLFIGRLWATLRQTEGGTGWLSYAALSGGLFYLLLELSRGVIVDAVIPRIGHGLDGPEAVTLWDLSNAFTVATWLAIALFLVPTAIVAIRKRALPLWLGILTALIAVANFVYGILPPSGSASLGESAFLLWILVTSVVLFFWRPLPARL